MESRAYDDQSPVLSHVEPVLAVKSVVESVTYWQDVLGFPDKWIRDPPTLGGVSWHGAAFIQFSEEPGLATASAGNSLWIRMRHVNTLYELHQRNGAAIVDPLQSRPWGFDQYTVKDMNGYYIHFASPAARRDPGLLPSPFRIVARNPTLEEHARVARAVGWLAEGVELKHKKSVMRVATVAEDITTGEVLGCAFLVGDNMSFYYIRDVMVLPDWQRRGVGTALVQGLIDWLKANASSHATVGLFTGDHLASFYRHFGFIQACGMYREVGDL